MSDIIKCNLLVIGAGPAGYTAGIYAARANLKPIIIEGLNPGGQLMTTTEIENYSGFADPVQGPWLMQQMRQQAENVGVNLVMDNVCKVDFTTQPYRIQTDDDVTYLARSVIISTGAQANWMGLPAEAEFMGRGVSSCATCDGSFFRDQRVAVVGGGDSAVEEALYLSGMCSKVTLIHRRGKLRAGKVLQDRLFARENVDVLWWHTVEDIIGDTSGVTELSLRETQTGATLNVAVDGLFVAIGHTPSTSLMDGQIETDELGYIVTEPGTTRTSRPGIFAAGDVQDREYRQAITAAGSGCMAALDAERYLSAHD